MPSAKRLSVAQRLPYLLPGPSAIALSPGRANDWDSIAVAHTDRREVSTWNFVKATRGRHWLDPRRFHGKGGEALRVHRHTIATVSWEGLYCYWWLMSKWGILGDIWPPSVPLYDTMWTFRGDWLLQWWCGQIQHAVGIRVRWIWEWWER